MGLQPELLTAIDALVQRQHGHIARWQLLGLGLSRRVIDRLPARFGWRRVHRGVHRAHGFATTPEGTIWAAILAAISSQDRGLDDAHRLSWQELHARACGSIGATGFSGAFLLGLTSNAPTTAQLLLPHDLRCRTSGIRIVRTRAPVPAVAPTGGAPAVPAIRALWDCAWILRGEPDAMARVRVLMCRADGLRLLEAEHLHLRARDPRSFDLPGVVPEAFRAAAFSLASGHSHSGTEHRARKIVTEIAASFGLHVEPRPLEIRDEDGIAGEADIAIPLLRLDIEIDGPHHDAPGQKLDDRRRDGRLRQVDWIVRRYPAALLDHDEAAFRAAVTADIIEAAALAGIALPGAA